MNKIEENENEIKELNEKDKKKREEAVQQFLEMPTELREFVAMPVNRPYLELAMKLSNMSRDKLRSVAEDLLDITL